jgi:hypothetical protein
VEEMVVTAISPTSTKRWLVWKKKSTISLALTTLDLPAPEAYS